MLNDKDIANLVLEQSKHHITDLTKSALESSGQLRQTLISMRDQCEQEQAALAQYAIQNNWYQPASPADPADIQKIVVSQQGNVGQPAMR